MQPVWRQSRKLNDSLTLWSWGTFCLCPRCWNTSHHFSSSSSYTEPIQTLLFTRALWIRTPRTPSAWTSRWVEAPPSAMVRVTHTAQHTQVQRAAVLHFSFGVLNAKGGLNTTTNIWTEFIPFSFFTPYLLFISFFCQIQLPDAKSPLPQAIYNLIVISKCRSRLLPSVMWTF